MGKPHFDAAGEFSEDRFFADALRLSALPSPETLRQRIEGMPEEAGQAFRDFTTRLLAAHSELLVETYRGQTYMPVNIDVSPMDNSGSHKEGVSCTYKKVDGYATSDGSSCGSLKATAGPGGPSPGQRAITSPGRNPAPISGSGSMGTVALSIPQRPL